MVLELREKRGSLESDLLLLKGKGLTEYAKENSIPTQGGAAKIRAKFVDQFSPMTAAAQTFLRMHQGLEFYSSAVEKFTMMAAMGPALPRGSELCRLPR